MTSRINIGRPVASSYNADPHGFSNSRQSSGYRAANPDDPLEKLRVLGKQVEDAIEIYSQPLRPHLPAIGRFLIVVTFYEDALRIITQWSDQLWYLQTHRHFYWGLSHFFLFLNVIVMLAASSAVISKRFSEYAVIGLFLVKNFAGLPSMSETDRKKYFLLAGRVLLIFLFLGFMLQGKWSVGRVVVSLFGLAACTMVAVGFKAKWSATFLVIVLSVFNVFANNWWSVHGAHPQRDFLKYDFFQTLCKSHRGYKNSAYLAFATAIVGGLILLVNIGPGGLSVDEKKKTY
ncbi:SURF4 family-domain-containing protein, partial [Boletus edulis]